MHYSIKAERVIIITDIHQNCAWVDMILRAEKGNYDHIIFNGDWFDTYFEPPAVYTAKETALFLIECMEGKYGPATFHIGNHDIAYMEGHKWVKNFQVPHSLKNICSGYSNSKSQKINKALDWEHWIKFQMFSEFGYFVISHAGITPQFWNDYKTEEENLDKIWRETQEALKLVSIMPSKYFQAGFSRGGTQTYGGIIWADWDCDFFDDIPVKQIVGHTTKYNTIRKTGDSFCIDGTQSTYCLLDKDGKIVFKTTSSEPIIIRDDSDFKNKISESYKY